MDTKQSYRRLETLQFQTSGKTSQQNQEPRRLLLVEFQLFTLDSKHLLQVVCGWQNQSTWPVQAYPTASMAFTSLCSTTMKTTLPTGTHHLPSLIIAHVWYKQAHTICSSNTGCIGSIRGNLDGQYLKLRKTDTQNPYCFCFRVGEIVDKGQL